ncbi:MAG: penicillin-binding protein activator [Paracoccaceae bacterium]|nr:penicillin-binding protein activator [Paracoccaceae bacterium]MDE2915184.1 penicillin-binding protein activator [Paracoccaceae bacterium]
MPIRLRVLDLVLLPALVLVLAVAAGCVPEQSAIRPTGKPPLSVTVALLVPAESGDARQDALADSLVRSAQLAVGDLGPDARIDLQVYATAADPETAVAAVRAAAEDEADIILGPLFSGVTVAVGKEADRLGLDVLSFSNNTKIAGGNIYVLGVSFENTADRLIAHAANQGISRIAVIAAQNDAGRLASGAVENAAVINGARVVSVATYERSAPGAIGAIDIIRETVTNSAAQAVVLDADTAGALPIFAEMLPEAAPEGEAIAEDVQFIGLTRWDIPRETLRQPGLEGGWFALPDPAIHEQFVRRYRNAHGTRPHPLSGLAYDGIALIGALASTGNPRALTEQGLTQTDGFVGVNGIFRLRTDGTVERRLAIARVHDGDVEIIEPAARTFDGGHGESS